jgi:hypothetical protein
VSHRALTHAVAVLAALLSLHAASAEASLPAHSEIQVGRCVEATDFRRLVESLYHVQFSRVVAADIDRDGDIDIIATTGRRLTVWVNDGAGHLTSQRPSSGPAIDARAPSTTFRGSSDRSDPTTNDGAPTTALLAARANGPPTFSAGDAAAFDFFAGVSVQLPSSAPRAPPTAS